MKVMLVTSKYNKVNVRWMPLGLCYLAASLRERGHKVEIVDRFAMCHGEDADRMDSVLLEKIQSMQPDWIGMNAVSPHIYDVVEVVRLVRTVYAGKIVLGGHHPTAMPRLTLERLPEIDAVICGEGEFSLCRLVEGESYQTIPGLAWMEKGEFHLNPSERIRDLDRLPVPAIDLLDLEFYIERNSRTIREFYLSVATMMISRGCKNRCSFCTETLTYYPGVFYHGTDYILDWMGTLLDTMPIDGITFLDSDFLADRARIEEICKGIIERGYHKRMIFCIQSRANHLDEEILRLLYAAGCRKIEIGIETIRKENLKTIAKNISLDQVEYAVQLCDKVGIRIQGNLIRGMEGERIEDLLETIQWCRRLPIDNLLWGLLMLLPGSRLYEEKGGRFFEETPWTEEQVTAYYLTDHLSKTTEEEMETIFEPALRSYRKFNHHRNFIRNNRLQDIWSYYSKQVKERWLQV